MKWQVLEQRNYFFETADNEIIEPVVRKLV